jgi:hypothetical protein
MIPPLSTRAFKYLQKINRKSGLETTDEVIFDMGARLLGLCEIVVSPRDREEQHLKNLLTEPETKALRILRRQFAATGQLCSARELSRAMGYQSSRSGHLLLHRLLSKGVLAKHAGQLSFVREYEGLLE